MEALELILEHPEAVKVILGALGIFIGVLMMAVAGLKVSGNAKAETIKAFVGAVDSAGKTGSGPVTEKIVIERNAMSKRGNKVLDKAISKMETKKEKDMN